jgi:energy-converting hydrogenase Eha subunit E
MTNNKKYAGAGIVALGSIAVAAGHALMKGQAPSPDVILVLVTELLGLGVYVYKIAKGEGE